jgi:hypothetical protein
MASSSFPTADEINTCISVLQRLKSADLATLSPELTSAGHELFKRGVKVELFGEDDVVAFLKKKEDYRNILKRLDKIHSEVERSHAQNVEVSYDCRSNNFELFPSSFRCTNISIAWYTNV